MKFCGILLTVIILSILTSTVYAHPVPLNVMVKDQGLVLFETELGGYGEQPEAMEQFSEEWISYSFIWILIGMISIIIAGVFITTYREEIFALAQIR